MWKRALAHFDGTSSERSTFKAILSEETPFIFSPYFQQRDGGEERSRAGRVGQPSEGCGAAAPKGQKGTLGLSAAPFFGVIIWRPI